MKRAGDLCKIDALGRIVIPIRLRRKFDLLQNDTLEIFTEGKSIILQKYIPTCIFCGNEDDLMELNEKYACKDCITLLAERDGN